MRIDDDARIRVRELERPAADDSARELMGDLAAAAAIFSAHWREVLGCDDLAETAEQWRIDWTAPSSWSQRYWVAELPGDGVVGYAQADLDEQDDASLAYLTIMVREGARRRGVGTALAEAVLPALAEAGRTRLESWQVHAADGAEWIGAPSGFGRVPADDAVARFSRRFGLSLGQVVRMSVLDIGGDDGAAEIARLESVRAEAAEAAGPRYRVLSWVAPSPPERLSGLAALAARMSTDEPSGGLEVVARTFDEERVRRNEARSAEKGSPLRYSVVEHIPSGELVAHSVLAVDLAHPERRAHQEDTLVLPEHRGRRLGWLVKTEGLLRLREDHPECRGVITWNAEENRPMLHVNEALGFRPILVEAAMEATAPLRRPATPANRLQK